MPEIWDADIQITESQAASLIAKQFHELAPVRLTLLGAGWDNVAFRVNETLVFRFPRRRIATQFMEAEARVLPLLAAHLPLPIPAPRFVGAPTDEYPHVFAGYPYLPGETACQRDWTDAERTRNAPVLARFLSALHRVPLDALTLAHAPKDVMNRAECARWGERAEARLRKNAALLAENGLDVETLVRATHDAATASAFDDALAWVHGDLYPRHLLVNADGIVSGVIDWGDVHVGDLALDLSIAFTFLPPSARAAFREVYGHIPPATWQRAHFRALHYGAVLTEYGAAIGDPAMRRMGLKALRFAIA